MNHSITTKMTRSNSEEEDSIVETLKKTNLYKNLSPNEAEYRMRKYEEKKKFKSRDKGVKINLSINQIMIIYTRRLRIAKKFFLLELRRRILMVNKREHLNLHLFKLIQNIFLIRKFNKIKSKSENRSQIIRSIKKFTHIFQLKIKNLFTNFVTETKLFSLYINMRRKLLRNLFKHINLKCKHFILKENLNHWRRNQHLLKKDEIKSNLDYFKQILKRKFNDYIFSNMKKNFILIKRENLLLKLIHRRLLFKKLKKWNFLIDKSTCTRNLRRKNYRTGKIKKILQELFLKYKQKQKIFFIRWKILNLTTKFSQPAKIIQRFMIFAHIKNKHFSIIDKISVQNRAIHKIFDLFIKRLYLIPFNKIKNENKRRVVINFVLSIKKKKLENFLYSWDKIQNFAKIKFMYLNQNATRIQANFKTRVVRKKIIPLLKRIVFLRYLLKKLFKINTIRNRIIKWKNATDKLSKQEDANILQKFMRSKIQKIKSKIKTSAMSNVRKMFLDFFVLRQLKPFFKIFLMTEILNRANFTLKNFFFKILIKKLVNFYTKKILLRFTKFLENSKIKNLSQCFASLKNYSIYNIETASAVKIQNYFRYSINKVKRNKIKILFRVIFNRTERKNKISLKFVLTNWKRNLKNEKLIKSANLISDFVRKKWISSKWKKLYKHLRQREDSRYIKTISESLNSFRNFSQVMKNLMRRKFLMSIRDYVLEKQKGSFLSHMLKNFYKRLEDSYMNYFFKSWLKKTENLKKLNKFFEIVSLNKKRKYFVKINYGGKLKHFNNLIAKLRIKIFFSILVSKSENGKNLEEFSENIIKLTKSLERNRLLILKNKIFKLYTYKIYSRFLNFLNKKFYERALKPGFKTFMENILKEQIQTSYYEGRRKNKLKKEIKLTQLSYKFKSTKLQAGVTSGNNNISYNIHALPMFMKIVSRGDAQIVKEFFKYLKTNSTVSKIGEKLNYLPNLITARQAFFDNLCKNCDNCEKLEKFQNRMGNLMKRSSLHKILKMLKQANRITKLMYFLKVIDKNKKFSELVFRKEIFSKLTLHCKINKITRQKLSTLYKSFYMSYLETTSTIFNDQELKKEYEEIRKRMIGKNHIRYSSKSDDMTSEEITCKLETIN